MFDFHAFMNEERRKSYDKGLNQGLDQGRNEMLYRRVRKIRESNPNISEEEALKQAKEEYGLI